MSTLYENERNYRSCSLYNNSPEPGRALLNVNNSGIEPTTIIPPLSSPIPVVSVSIDTTNMCNPKVLLTFTSLICLLSTVEVRANLSFIIVKTVDDGSPHSINGTHTFSESIIANVPTSDSFAFQYCDCNPTYGNITYTIQLSSVNLIPTTVRNIMLTIANATLSALAVETL